MIQSSIRSALSCLAWGYLLLFFHINLGSIPIVPEGVAYLILVRGILLLRDEERDFALLWPFGVFLALLNFVQLLFPGQASSGLLSSTASSWLTLLQTVFYLYFHFGLLTACARLAERYQPGGWMLGRNLRFLRNIFVILDTLVSAILMLWMLPSWISVVSAIILLLTALLIASALFRLRRIFSSGPAPADPDAL